MAYYDRIAKKWHTVTGHRGGALKRYLLNGLLLDKVDRLDGRALLELGAGNGYFMPLLLEKFAGRELPGRIAITDQSEALLDLAQRHFRIDGAEYCRLDIRRPFPFDDDAFDLILATMVFNEVATGGVAAALEECHRVLTPDGRLLATVLHPSFVASLAKRKELKADHRGRLTMPGSEGLRLPVVKRRVSQYEDLLDGAGFAYDMEHHAASDEILRAKPGLKQAGGVPIVLIFDCRPRPG